MVKVLGEDEAPPNPIKGRWTALAVIAAVVLGLSSLLIFLTPEQIFDAFEVMPLDLMLYSLALFVLGCWITVERWRACLSFRADRWKCFHTMGVAHAGNLLIPGRIGEPLRVYLLARLGVAPEFGTSAVVQERLADQALRVVFLSGAILLSGVSGGGQLGTRLGAVTAVTIAVVVLVVALVSARQRVASKVGGWLGKLPMLNAEAMESYVLKTLDDLGESWTHPGGKKALLWGLLGWLVFAVHTQLILDAFFSTRTLAMAFVILALTPATAPTQPGFFHGLAAAALLMMGAEKVPAIQATVVIHMIQMVLFTIWGVGSWLSVHRSLKTLQANQQSGE